MKRLLCLVYGVASYCMFLGVFAYSVGFIGNIAVPTSLDAAPTVSIGRALLVNAALLAVFALQHSVMARPWFKQRWTKLIPEAVERSTYVVASNLAMILMFVFWQPMGGTIWEVEGALRVMLYVGFGLGWATVFYSTLLISHFDLFGLRQVWLYYRGEAYTQLPFRTPSLYKYVRHPLYVGWLMVMWFTPLMTLSHLFFAVGSTAYILIAIQFEERDLVNGLPGYSAYRKRVPMLVPSVSAQEPDDSAPQPVQP